MFSRFAFSKLPLRQLNTVRPVTRQLHQQTLWTTSPRALSKQPRPLTKSCQRRWYSAERDRAALGVFTPTSAGIFVLVGAALFFYFKYEKEQLQREREKERESRSYGRAQIGGPFNLQAVTPDPKPTAQVASKPFSDKDMLGKWSLVYFGFTNCPDICPTEMDKMGRVMDELEQTYGKDVFQPIFITVDPVRDYPSRIAQYLSDFHRSFIGVFGSYAETKALCKLYRVYFSTPPDAKEDGDYLVDHSIFVYLMDPKGQFVEAFGQAVEAPDVIKRTAKEVEEWKTIYGKTT